MKERIFTNWTITRALYLFMGIAIIIQSVVSQQYLGMAFGAYFASMGLFAFGCAAGNCAGASCETTSQQKSKSLIEDVEFETIENK